MQKKPTYGIWREKLSELKGWIQRMKFILNSASLGLMLKMPRNELNQELQKAAGWVVYTITELFRLEKSFKIIESNTLS